MELVVAVIVMFVGVGILLLRRQTGGGSSVRSSTRPPPDSNRARSGSARAPYQAVSIMTPRLCCQSATTIEGRKFLVPEAPRLPLADCDHGSCKCGYIRHTDRREDDHERRGPPGLKSELYALESGEERRATRGRRWSDYSMA